MNRDNMKIWFDFIIYGLCALGMFILWIAMDKEVQPITFHVELQTRVNAC